MLEKDKLCYTINSDGTLEKWYFSGYSDIGAVVVRKEKSRKWIQTWKMFAPEKVFESRKEANAALIRGVTENG